MGPLKAGAFGAVVMVIATYLAVRRLYWAVWMNQRYRKLTFETCGLAIERQLYGQSAN